jgi:DNA repair protein RecO (recombination protein O)
VAAIQTEALVLRAVDFGESDRIVHLLVRDGGRVSAMAKGARRSVRRFGGTLDLFNHLRISIDRRRSAALARLDQATLIRSFTALRRDPARFALGCYLLELIGRLAPEDGVRADVQRLFEFVLAALNTVGRQVPDARLRALLELRALDALGLCPELERCVRCGRRPHPGVVLGFHVSDGGPVCAACGARLQGLLPVHPGTLRALQQGLRFDLDQLERLVLPPGTLAEARQLLARFQRFHVGMELRSEAFLERVLEARRSGPGIYSRPPGASEAPA